MLEEIGAGERPRLLVLGKADLLDELGRTRAVNGHRDALLVSAVTGEGLDALRERIDESSSARWPRSSSLIPYAEGARLAELHELAGELEREDTPDGVRVARAAARRQRRALRSASRRRGRAHERFASPVWRRTRVLPTRAYPGDAGLDLYAAHAARLAAGERASVGTGIAVAIPEGHAGLVAAALRARRCATGSRSSTRPA